MAILGKGQFGIKRVVNGTDGYTQQMLTLYKRSTSKITSHGINSTLTYLFSEGTISGNANGWTIEVPPGEGDIYVIQTLVRALADYTAIAPSVWSSPVRQAVSYYVVPQVLVRTSADAITSVAGGFNPATISAQRVLKVGEKVEVLDNLLDLNSFIYYSFYEYLTYFQHLSNVTVTYDGNCEIEAWVFLDENRKAILNPSSGLEFWYPDPRHTITCPDGTCICKIFLHKGNVSPSEIKATVREAGIKYAGRNLLPNSNFKKGLVFDQLNVFPAQWSGWNRKAINNNSYGSGFTCFTHQSKSSNASIETLIPLQKNTKYRLSFTAYVSTSLMLQPMLRYINNNNSESNQIIQIVNGQGDNLSIIDASFTTASQFKEVSLLLVTDLLTAEDNSLLFLSPIKLELGDKATPWGPAPEDATLKLNGADYVPGTPIASNSEDQFVFSSDWNGQRDSRTVAVTPGRSLDYLKEAFQGTTKIEGGVVQTSAALFEDGIGEVKSYINGNSSLNPTAFAAGVTNFNTPQEQKIIDLKHEGKGSKIGIFEVGEDFIRINGEGDRSIIITSKKIEELKYVVAYNYSLPVDENSFFINYDNDNDFVGFHDFYITDWLVKSKYQFVVILSGLIEMYVPSATRPVIENIITVGGFFEIVNDQNNVVYSYSFTDYSDGPSSDYSYVSNVSFDTISSGGYHGIIDGKMDENYIFDFSNYIGERFRVRLRTYVQANRQAGSYVSFGENNEYCAYRFYGEVHIDTVDKYTIIASNGIKIINSSTSYFFINQDTHSSAISINASLPSDAWAKRGDLCVDNNGFIKQKK